MTWGNCSGGRKWQRWSVRKRELWISTFNASSHPQPRFTCWLLIPPTHTHFGRFCVKLPLNVYLIFTSLYLFIQTLVLCVKATRLQGWCPWGRCTRSQGLNPRMTASKWGTPPWKPSSKASPARPVRWESRSSTSKSWSCARCTMNLTCVCISSVVRSIRRISAGNAKKQQVNDRLLNTFCLYAACHDSQRHFTLSHFKRRREQKETNDTHPRPLTVQRDPNSLWGTMKNR